MRNWKRIQASGTVKMFIVPAAVSLFTCLFLYYGILESLERLTLDLRIRAAGAGDPAPVAFASIDQNSLKALGEWPLPRGLYSRIISSILDDGARAVLVDIDFSSLGPDPEQDRQFAEYVSRSGKVVLAVQMEERITTEGAVIRNLSLPFPELADGAMALGSITFEIDNDGIIRRVPSNIDFVDTSFKPLGLVGAEIVGRQENRDIPHDALIAFSSRNLSSYPNVNIDNIMGNRFRAGTFRDRVVFLGSTTPELHDFWSTPIGVIPGMYIQASVLETGFGQSWSTRQNFPSAAVMVILVSFVFGRLIFRADWKRSTVYLAGYITLIIVASFLFSLHGVMIHVMPLLVAGLIQYPIQIIMALQRTEETLVLQRRRTDTILKFSELQDAEEAGKDTSLVPLILLRQLLGLKKITLYLEDGERRNHWRIVNVIGEGMSQQEKEPEILRDVVEKRQILYHRDEASGIVSLYVPMMTSRKVVGILCAVGPGDFTRDEENVRLILSYATQTSYSIEARELDSRIKILYSNTIRAITKALDTRDYYTSAHAELSLEYVEKFGQACGLSRFEIEALHIGTLLHDIGKIGVPDQVLSKSGKLSREEFDMMKQHPTMGYEIIRDLPLPGEVKMIVRHHHEHFDGKGYPDGLKGEEIPKLVRIFSVLDTYEALVGKRPYKASFSPEEAKQELLKNAGKQFDPEIVEKFTTIF